MKKLFFLIILGGSALVFNACSAGYADQEPTYVEVVRPSSPGVNFIWIEGGWVWNNRERRYRHREGYWARPNHVRPYKKGYWEKSPRGYHWRESRR